MKEWTRRKKKLQENEKKKLRRYKEENELLNFVSTFFFPESLFRPNIHPSTFLSEILFRTKTFCLVLSQNPEMIFYFYFDEKKRERFTDRSRDNAESPIRKCFLNNKKKEKFLAQKTNILKCFLRGSLRLFIFFGLGLKYMLIFTQKGFRGIDFYNNKFY